MKILSFLFAAVLSFALMQPAFSQTKGYKIDIPENIMTPGEVTTPLGTYKFYDGMPYKETASKVYDGLDFVRGVDVYLNFLPAVNLADMRKGHVDLGVRNCNEVIVFDNLMDAISLFLTGNASTVYASAFLDLEKDGPTVIEIPKGAGPGTLNDAFFRFVIDMGAPGPDRGQGGTYIILPPDYKGDLKPTPNTPKDNSTVKVKVGNETKDVWIAKSRSYVNWLILRGFLVDGKPDAASKMWRTQLKIYPLKGAANPPEMKFVNASGKEFNTIFPNNIEFYYTLAKVLDKEPLDLIGPELRGQAGAIGIAKGQSFNLDERMKNILGDAAAFAVAASRVLAFRPRDERAKVFPDRNWYLAFVGNDYRWLDGDGMRGRNLDARIAFFYIATVNTPAMAVQIPGAGSNYAMEYTDNNGDVLKGSENYVLHLPANIPAKNFWSVTIYDPQTRSQLQTDQKYPSKNNKRDKLVFNKDGSIDLFFGPEKPKDKKKAANWIETVPGKGWFAVLRLYGPLEPWFEKTWKPDDIKLVE